MSKSCFRKSGDQIDQYGFHDENLETYLLSFIENFYKEDKFSFRPDLSSANYAFLVQDWFNSKKNQFLPINLNPANL